MPRQMPRTVPTTLDHNDATDAATADRIGRRTTWCRPWLGAIESACSAIAVSATTATASVSTDAVVLRGSAKPTATPIAPRAAVVVVMRRERRRWRRRIRRVSILPLFRLATRPLRRRVYGDAIPLSPRIPEIVRRLNSRRRPSPAYTCQDRPPTPFGIICARVDGPSLTRGACPASLPVHGLERVQLHAPPHPSTHEARGPGTRTRSRA